MTKPDAMKAFGTMVISSIVALLLVFMLGIATGMLIHHGMVG